MPGLAKLFVVALVIFAVWYALRLVNRRPPPTPVQPGAKKPAIEAEDLVSCRICASYVPMGSRNCGKPGCPRPQ
jgi:hypothetical protein